MADFQPKYLFYLVNKIPKLIFYASASSTLNLLPSKVKLFLLIISKSIYWIEKVVKQKIKLIKSSTKTIVKLIFFK